MARQTKPAPSASTATAAPAPGRGSRVIYSAPVNGQPGERVESIAIVAARIDNDTLDLAVFPAGGRAPFGAARVPRLTEAGPHEPGVRPAAWRPAE